MSEYAKVPIMEQILNQEKDSIPVLIYDFEKAMQKEEYEKCAIIQPQLRRLAARYPELFRTWFTSGVTKKINYSQMDQKLNGALKGILY